MRVKDTLLYAYFRRTIYLITIHPGEIIRERKRRKGNNAEGYDLKKYKDIHKDKRCFIIATGPSLTADDYMKLRDEHTIGVNGLCLWFEKYGVETEYFVVSDDEVFDRIRGSLDKTSKAEIFVSERVKKTFYIPEKYKIFPVDIWNRFSLENSRKRFSNDISICSYDEETVVFHAIQLAVYMGFTDIYLIGTDCNYDQSKAYAVDHGKKVDDISIGLKMVRSYEVVKQYESKYNFRVYNATRGGMLEVFDRVDLDKVLGEKSR